MLINSVLQNNCHPYLVMSALYQMVFRPYPDKFKEMKYMCDEFLLSVESIVEWISVVKSLRIEDVINQVRNWQVLHHYCFY